MTKMEQYQICKERADWIGQQIGHYIAQELQRGHQHIHIRIENDDPGFDYVMVDMDSHSNKIMIDADAEWRNREYEDSHREG